MFKSARWRNEKNKIKTVFKLQFHATQVSQVVGDALIVSIVPADFGKPTAKLEKARIQDGSCYWDNPVYEAVKFVQEQKSGKIHERIYNFVVGIGSSKAGVIGEASIDFSSYALATKISSVSLPLKNSKSEMLLHVTIQRMPESFDQREVEEIKNVKLNSQEKSLSAQLSNDDLDGSIITDSIEDAPVSKSINQNVEMNGNRWRSSGSDITMSSSDSSLGLELDTQQEIQIKTDNVHREPTSLLRSSNNGSLPQTPISDAPGVVYNKERRGSWEWLGGMALEASTEDSSGTPRETLLRVVSEEAPDTVVEKLKYELTALARQAEMSELELQTLRKQIVKESKRGQDLSREIVKLKEERDVFKEECEKLKASQCRLDEAKARNKMQFEGGDPPSALLEELRQELSYEKDLNNDLRIQLQKTQESNNELILAVRDLDEMLEQKNKEIANKSAPFGSVESIREREYKSETDDDDPEQKALEELVKEHTDAKDAYLLEQKVMDLQSEIEIYRRERDELEMQMEQLALDYEILKQENHDMSYKLEQSQLQEQLKMQYECSSSFATVNELDAQIENLENELHKRTGEFSNSLNTISELESQIKNLENELKNRSQEYSGSLITIKELETQVKNFESELKNRSQEHSDSLIRAKQLEDHINGLEEELENQAHGFVADLEDLTHARVEQERRAIQAEDTLRKMRWQNASTAERLQEEFRKLSMQMSSTFEANECLATKAMGEANELHFQKTRLEEKLQEASESLEMVREHYEGRLDELSGLVVSMSNRVEELQLEVYDKSKQLENQLKCAEEVQSQLAAELERGIILVKEKAEESLRELQNMTRLKDEKEAMTRNLQSEVKRLKARCQELKHMLSGDELEKKTMRKQVLQLKGDLKKKEDVCSSMEKKLKSNKFQPAPPSNKEVASLKEKIKLLEGQIKLKETALEKSTNSFLEKERDLHNEIKELEQILEELGQNATSLCEQKSDKATEVSEDRGYTEMMDSAKNPSTKACVSSDISPITSGISIDDASEKESTSLARNSRKFGEITLLKERNKVMEDELKEMQERYSEISLKFAEVEGERQQLVMRLRNLKNSKNTLS